jgi:hypothetical protein
MTKIMMSHFAISIEKPATPRAPNMYATSANIRKSIARPIKPGMFTPVDMIVKSKDFYYFLYFLYKVAN